MNWAERARKLKAVIREFFAGPMPAPASWWPGFHGAAKAFMWMLEHAADQWEAEHPEVECTEPKCIDGMFQGSDIVRCRACKGKGEVRR